MAKPQKLNQIMCKFKGCFNGNCCRPNGDCPICHYDEQVKEVVKEWIKYYTVGDEAGAIEFIKEFFGVG